MFLHALRALLHQHAAVCVFTLPAPLYSAAVLGTVHRLCHLALVLHDLPPSSPWAAEHCALLTVLPPAPFHTLTPVQPEHSAYLLHVSDHVRLDKLSLPPEDSRDDEEGQGTRAPPAKERGRVEVEDDSRVGAGTGKEAAGRNGQPHQHQHGGGTSCATVGKHLDF